VELDKELDALRRRGLEVAAPSYDSVAILEEFSKRKHIHYPLLSDPGSSIIRRFGLLNRDYPEGDPAHGVPWPGTLVIDAQGLVRSKLFEKIYSERRTAASLLVLEGESRRAATSEIRTDHFVLRLSSSNEAVAAMSPSRSSPSATRPSSGWRSPTPRFASKARGDRALPSPRGDHSGARPEGPQPGRVFDDSGSGPGFTRAGGCLEGRCRPIVTFGRSGSSRRGASGS
jgi:hypothetical protein